MNIDMRKTGIDVVGNMPWGSHFCLFYETKADLLETAISYCKAGLESQEFCLWVVADPLSAEDASYALEQAVPDFHRYVIDQSIEIVAARDWYLQDGVFDLSRVIRGWNEKLARASARGYAGVRVTGDVAWLEKKDWKDFCEYEESLNQAVANQRLAVLCTYPLSACGAAEILDVVRTHQFAVTKRRGGWDVIETAGHKQAKAEIKRLNEELEQRVVERTSQLTAVNEELRREVLQRQRVEEALLRSEAYLAEAQRISHTGSSGWDVSTGQIYWSEETFRIVGCDRTVQPTLELVLDRTHPEDRAFVRESIRRAVEERAAFDFEHRLSMPDGSTKHVRVVGHPTTPTGSGDLKFVGAITDITQHKRVEEALLRSEAYLAEGQKLSHTGSWACNIATREMIHSSEEHRRLFGLVSESGRIPPFEDFFQRIHPEDRERASEDLEKAIRTGANVEAHFRIVLPEGTTRYMYGIGHPLVRPSGETDEFVGAVMDITESKRAEESLRQTEGYLAEAQRLTHTGSWVWEVAGRDALHLSDEWYRIYGFDPQAGVPNWEERLQRIHPEDRILWQSTIDRAITEKSGYELEFRILIPDGTVRYVHTVGHPVLNAFGDAVQFVGSSIDITERKRAEALRDGESRILEMIARDAPLDAILENLVLVVEGQFPGMFCFVLLLDDDGLHARHGAAPSLPQAYSAAIDGLCIGPKSGSCGTAMYRKEPVVVIDILQDPLWEQYRAVAEPYGFRACWSTPILSYSGKALGSFAMYYREPRSPNLAETRALEMATHLAGNAIERKMAREKLQRSEAYLAEAQRLSHTGSWAFNTREAVYWSEENFRIWGFDPQHGLPKRETMLQRIHPEDRHRVLECVQKAVREKTDYAVEFRILLPDGAVKHIHGLGHPVFSASGELVEVVGTQLDVTERRRAEAERERLRQAQADLAHINRVTTMGELTASLAHEIKQPIAAAVTNAKTCLRWLRRDAPDVAEACEAASRLVTDVTRSSDIISRISLMFKKGAQQHELVDVNELIQEMIVLLRSEASRYSISIRGDLANDLSPIMADRVQLQQVLMNLMLNGIEAMKDMDTHGELTIKSRQTDNRQLLISVSDTGAGIEPKQAEQIFNAFFTTKPQGTGMGLPISRSIIESHGGRLWATANSGRGATFQFTLPSEATAHQVA